jgi:CDGSH-type Zn-finger protein
MPTLTTEDRNGHLRTTVQIQPGERVKLCRCMRSKIFPLCDEAHKTIPDTNAGPVIVEAVMPEEEKQTTKPTV